MAVITVAAATDIGVASAIALATITTIAISARNSITARSRSPASFTGSVWPSGFEHEEFAFVITPDMVSAL